MTGYHSHRRSVAGVLTLLILSLITANPLIPRASPQQSGNLALSVDPAPNTIPADGGEYQIILIQIKNSTGKPVPAPTDIPVILSSSKLEVGTVEPSITIRQGATYVIAKFRSTATAGVTTVTAAATGFKIGTNTVTTVDPSSSPMRLVVQLAPKQLSPEMGARGIVVVQLQDANGILARAADPILVSLSSSLPNIARVDSSIQLEAGQSYGQASFYATFTPGTTTITASASGYAIGSDDLTIEGPTPAKLAVYTTPPQIPERAGANSTILVQLQDENGIPVRAPGDISIAITSSDTTVGSIDQTTITLSSGKTDAATSFFAELAGTTKITATAQKYGSGSSDITVVRAGLAERGNLGIYIAPPVVLPDDLPHRSVYVQLQDTTGQTVRATNDVAVHLASSDTDIGTVDSDLIIPAGSTYGVATFRSTHAAGRTTLTASAADFITAETVMNVAGSVPSRIAVDVVPQQIPSDGRVHPSIVLQMQSITGEPVNAPSDIVVTLSSSRTDIGSVDGTVVLPSGKSTAMATFYSTLVAGSTIITASASGYVPGSIEVKTVEPTPSTLAVVTSPSILPADGETYNAIVIQIQDANGIPARARKDVQISISSSASNVGEADHSVILPEGETFVRADFRTSGHPGTTTISALSSGFAGSSSDLTTILHSFTVGFSQQEASINMSGTAYLVLTVKSSGVPVPNATVVWMSTNGTLFNEATRTDASGTAKASFRNNVITSSVITAQVSKSGFYSTSGNITITTTPLPLQLTLSPAPTVTASKPADINVTVISGGEPVSNVTLEWSTTRGTFASKDAQTDADGTGKAVLLSNDAGSADIYVVARKEGYNATSASSSVTVSPPATTTTTTAAQPSLGVLGFTFMGLDFLTVIILIAVVIAATIAIIFIIRRRRSGEEDYEEDDMGDMFGED